MSDQDQSLAIRAAWLHYIGGFTQADVARRLGIPSVKAHRLIARAVADGVVKVSIDGTIAECAALEVELCRVYGLSTCEVAPDIGEEGLALSTLGAAGADYLRREIERGEARVIGVGHGRTLFAAVRNLPKVAAGDVTFVSLLGGLTRNYTANPFDVIHVLAEKAGVRAYVMPVPFFANTEEDREVLLAQKGVSEVFHLAAHADLKLVGIGTVDRDAHLLTSGMLEDREIGEIAALGGVGEMLGHFFDIKGRVLSTPVTARTLAAPFLETGGDRVVAIAGGPKKTEAIRAVLHANRLTGLITDERTAKALLGR
ncbi:sugar-binding transcriptional regulator [Ensifer soli]|uniref:sugar-binding transcriptional regulator n=1 Tax=Ciceribacter sp. sgz301302 TaxID=3342379 RepID=UPI0035B7CB2F